MQLKLKECERKRQEAEREAAQVVAVSKLLERRLAQQKQVCMCSLLRCHVLGLLLTFSSHISLCTGQGSGGTEVLEGAQPDAGGP